MLKIYAGSNRVKTWITQLLRNSWIGNHKKYQKVIAKSSIHAWFPKVFLTFKSMAIKMLYFVPMRKVKALNFRFHTVTQCTFGIQKSDFIRKLLVFTRRLAHTYFLWVTIEVYRKLLGFLTQFLGGIDWRMTVSVPGSELIVYCHTIYLDWSPICFHFLFNAQEENSRY